MPRVLPPPQERFDPIAERWVTPGGPLHDPARDAIDPGHSEPVQLVGPVPRELAGVDLDVPSRPQGGRSPLRRLVWIVAVLALAAAVFLVLGR